MGHAAHGATNRKAQTPLTRGRVLLRATAETGRESGQERSNAFNEADRLTDATAALRLP